MKKYFYFFIFTYAFILSSMESDVSIVISPGRGPGIGPGIKQSELGNKIAPTNVEEMHELVRSHRKESVVPPFSKGQLEKTRHRSSFSPSGHAGYEFQGQKLYTHDQVQALYNAQKRRKSHKLYTQQEVSDILHEFESSEDPALSARVYKLGREYNVSLDELPLYADIFSKVDVQPEILAAFIQKKHGNLFKQPQARHTKGYEKILKEDPEKYEKLVFGLIQAMVDANEENPVEGQAQLPSLFVDTHVDLLEKQIVDQSVDLYLAKIALVVKFLWGVGATAWAIWGQINQSTHVCHNTTR